MPFCAYYLDADGHLHTGLGEEEVRHVFESKQGLLWVDICDTTEEDGRFLEQVFQFHHLAVDDCVSSQVHPPKIDDLADCLFIIVHGVNHTAESNIVETTELALFLGQHYVVSNHNLPLYSVQGVKQAVEEDGRPMKRGAVFLTHALIDALILNIMPTIDLMGDRADEIEEEVIRRPQRSTLELVMQLKRSTLRLHRIMAPQREVLNRLSRREFPLITSDAEIFYRDVYDRIVRLEDLNQTLRDRADNALATYLSSVANRQNETMKILAIVATIFMPLTLLAGIYGMNFEHMPELEWTWSYFAVLGLIGTVIVGAIWLLWARNWFPFARGRGIPVRPLVVDPERLVGYLGDVKRWRHFLNVPER